MQRLLQQPEYIHAAINHFPLVGLFVAMLALVAALILRNRPATLVGLGLLALFAISVWPVVHFGEAGYDRVLSMADDPGQAYLRYHAHLADRWVWLYFVTSGVSAAALGLSWKWPRVLTPLSVLSLALAIASLTAGTFIAEAGGEIRHREFRFGPAPVVKESN